MVWPPRARADVVRVADPEASRAAGCGAPPSMTKFTAPPGVPADELTAAVSDRTRVILVNDPHNPTGAVLPAETRELIVRLAERHDAVILTHSNMITYGFFLVCRDICRLHQKIYRWNFI